jgi:hypothetical protein
MVTFQNLMMILTCDNNYRFMHSMTIVKLREYQYQTTEEYSCHKYERKKNKVKLQTKLQQQSYNTKVTTMWVATIRVSKMELQHKICSNASCNYIVSTTELQYESYNNANGNNKSCNSVCDYKLTKINSTSSCNLKFQYSRHKETKHDPHLSHNQLLYKI